MFPLPFGHFEAKLQIFQEFNQSYVETDDGQESVYILVLDAGFIYSL